jgi:sn-glycerol 3-phosphate transport system ATP-binding protein
LVLVGPSGCGKSTILRIIAGLESVDEGTVKIEERVVNALEPMERNVAMVFQNYALYPHMSVFKNMAYGLKVRGTPRQEIVRRVKEAAVMLGIEEYLDRKPRQLSGGQRQRVAMGRAIVRDPSVFLLDEPLSNLDARLRMQMRVELKRLHRKLGNTFIYVTHDQVEAMTLGDRIMVMSEGRVEQIGTPEEVYISPRTIFTAGFIGSPSMNFLRGRAVNCGSMLLVGSEVEVRLEQPIEGRYEEIIVGVRPEHLNITDSVAGGGCTLTADVDIVESLGGEMLVHCRTQDTRECLVVKVHSNEYHGSEGTVSVHFNSERIHLFDPKSGLCIGGKPVF